VNVAVENSRGEGEQMFEPRAERRRLAGLGFNLEECDLVAPPIVGVSGALIQPRGLFKVC